MTGAPIYLVSACASGEEFVAAFRRYADKNELFVPIREPLPVGCRGRFAVTLKDGGVMIEGAAEIVRSAPTASVLHGRVGMTLRFLEPDAASKTLLRELERARLAMRPAPPSVPPRPAEIPAEPRPVPPRVQGRVDAVNALAECVVIGDTSALGPPAAAAPVAPPPVDTARPGRASDTDAGVPRRESPAVPPRQAPGVPSGATYIGMPPIPRVATPANPLPAVQRPAPPIIAPARPPIFEVEIAEPTDISPGPPELPPEPPPPAVVAPAPAEPPISRQHNTVIGVIIAPSGIPVLPATVRIMVGDSVPDSAVDASSPTVIPGPPFSSMLDDAAASDDMPMPPGGAMSTSVPGPSAAPAGLPTGDWTIALDPQAPDGWSEPFASVSPEHLATAQPPPDVAEVQPRDPVPVCPTPAPGQPLIVEGYPMDPMAGLPAPGPLASGDSGLHDPRHATEPVWPVRTGRPRSAIIVIASALVAVVIGLAVFAVLRS